MRASRASSVSDRAFLIARTFTRREPGAFPLRVLAIAFLLAMAPVARAAAPADSAAAPRDTALVRTLVLERAVGKFGVGPGELSGPLGVTVDPKGRALVADAGNHRIARFDTAGVWLGEFGGFGYDDNRFDRPSVVWSGGALAVWVLDQGNARVVKYDLDGRLLGVLVQLRSDEVRARLDLVEPGGLAVDKGGQLFVTDASADRVLLFDPLGAVLTPRGGFGTQPGRFDRPSGIAVDERGRLLVADAGNRRVQLLDAFGEALAAWPLDRGMTGKEGLAVAFGPDGSWALADRASGTIVVRDVRGVPLARLDAHVKGDPRPGGVAFDAEGRLLVTDARNHRLLWYRLSP
jgi:DNA-binding beta-propeller fold protein YncE